MISAVDAISPLSEEYDMTTDPNMSDSSVSNCGLLSLPAELRQKIYGCALAPTGWFDLSVDGISSTLPKTGICVGLLATCRQVYTESINILYDCNIFFLRLNFLVDFLSEYCPVYVLQSRLPFPQRAMERVQHLYLILDITPRIIASVTWSDDVDDPWKPFTAFVSLQDLKITVLCDYLEYDNGYEYSSLFLQKILERVPPSTDLTWETTDGSMERYYLDKYWKSLRYLFRPAKEVKGKHLEILFNSIGFVERGRLSGTVANIYTAVPSSETKGPAWSSNAAPPGYADQGPAQPVPPSNQ